MKMDIETIKQYVPHRYPFILIDRVLEVSPEKIVAIKNVTINEPFFQGHFPEKAIFPGVLMIEAMAQTSGVLAYYAAGVKPEDNKDLYFFAGIDKARFKKTVVPGDQIKFEVEFLQQKNNFSIFKTKCVAKVDDEIACSAELLVAKKSKD